MEFKQNDIVVINPSLPSKCEIHYNSSMLKNAGKQEYLVYLRSKYGTRGGLINYIVYSIVKREGKKIIRLGERRSILEKDMIKICLTNGYPDE